MSRLYQGNLFPILTVVAAIVVIWYAGTFYMNAQFERDQAQRAAK